MQMCVRMLEGGGNHTQCGLGDRHGQSADTAGQAGRAGEQGARPRPAHRGGGGGQGLAHVVRPELDADARADGLGGLGDCVLPGALARAAHHEQVAMTVV